MRSVTLVKKKKNEPLQHWGHTNTGRFYAYETRGFIKMKYTANDGETPLESEELFPFVLDPHCDNILFPEAPPKQQQWHLHWTRNEAEENIVEIDDWSMEGGKLIEKIPVSDVTIARDIAKQYLEKNTSTEDLWCAIWYKDEKMMYIKQIVPENHDHTFKPPYKLDEKTVLWFVGLQFHTKDEEQSVEHIMSKLNIVMGKSPSKAQVESYGRFMWMTHKKNPSEEIDMQEARVLTQNSLDYMGPGAVFNDVAFQRVFKAADVANNNTGKMGRGEFIEVLWGFVHIETVPVVVMHSKASRNFTRRDTLTLDGKPLPVTLDLEEQHTEGVYFETDELFNGHHWYIHTSGMRAILWSNDGHWSMVNDSNNRNIENILKKPENGFKSMFNSVGQSQADEKSAMNAKWEKFDQNWAEGTEVAKNDANVDRTAEEPEKTAEEPEKPAEEPEKPANAVMKLGTPPVAAADTGTEKFLN